MSPKRGFADVGASYGYLQSVNAGWYYGWRPDKPGGSGNFNAEFVPMIWGGYQANQFEINRILGYGDVEYVLGFNEPEREDQANMSVSQAIAAWRTLSAGFSGSRIKLISPGVSDTGDGQAWLASFMNQANAEGLKVDGVAFHWYGVSNPNDPVGAANSFLSRVDSYHNSYGLPVWITEFAINDWGGNYTQAEMREANAIFLDRVIPALESRSYVEKYAFYNWFGDSTLVEGSPLTPTNVGRQYVGAIEPGEVYNLSGVDLGEHVAYLTGGELTHSGGAAGAVRYINALAGASRLTGATDWGLGQGDWVRVQPAATLVKSSSNRVTFDMTDVTNDGVIEVSGGELALTGTTLSGGGAIRVGSGGTLAFVGQVRGGPGRFGHAIELNGGAISVPEATDAVVLSGGVLSGEGVVTGGLATAAGGLVRVGGVGLSAPAWTTIDDFQSYDPGKLNAGATGGVWTGVFDGTANAQIVSAPRNKTLEYYGTGSSWRGARANLSESFDQDYSVANGETATYFFRVQRQGAEAIDGVFGLTDLEAIGTGSPWSELAVTLSLFQGSGAGDTTALRAYDNGGGDVEILGDVAAGEWVNVWLVVDNAAKTFEVATSTGADDGELFARTFNFGRQAADGASLQTFAGAERLSGSNPTNASVRIDDLVYLAGENLINPLGGSAPGVVLDAGVLRVEGDFAGFAGATLELDLYDPAVMDRLEVTGTLNAAGTLAVNLDSQAPAPTAGDAFDLLDFASAVGQFDELLLPTLTDGLSWDVSQLYTTGVLSVTAGLAGDYNSDGVVDAADYSVWRDSLGSTTDLAADGDGDGEVNADDYQVWRSNYGSTAAGAAAASAPEPGCLLLAAGGAMIAIAARRRVRSLADYAPRCWAANDRALAMSSVPDTMHRPSVKSVSTCSPAV